MVHAKKVIKEVGQRVEVRKKVVHCSNEQSSVLNLTGRRSALVPRINPIPHNIIEVTGEGITDQSTRPDHIMLELAGEAFPSHEVSTAACAASVDACHVKSTLELWSQSMCNVRIDPIVGGVAVTWVAAAAVEAQAGDVFRIVITFTFPRAGANDPISEDSAKGNSRAIVNEGGGGGLRRNLLKVVGLGVVQLEEQEESVMAWEFAPKKYWRLLKNLRNVG